MSVTVNTTNNIVTVTQNSNTTVTVQSPGLIGPAGSDGNIPADNIIQPFNDITASGDITVQGTFNGNITASGNISASGGGSFDYIDVANSGSFYNVVATATGVGGGNITALGHFIGGGLKVSPSAGGIGGNIITYGGGNSDTQGAVSASGLLYAKHISYVGNITASGDISASGTIKGATGIFGTATTTINDNVHTTGYISTDTNVTASGNISSSGNVYASRFVSNGNQIAYNDSGITYFGTATQANKFTNHITASGNISASGWISGSNIFASYDINASRDIFVGRNLAVIGNILNNGSTNFGNSADDTHSFTGHIVASSAPIFAQSHITASGNISSSGAITGGSYFSDSSYAIGTTEVLKYESERILLPGNLTIDGSQVVTHITASGNISASGTGSFNIIELAPDGAIQPSVNGSTISFRNAPHNSADWMEIGNNLFNVYMDGGGSLTVTPTVLLLNSNAANQDVKINYNDISSAFVSDAASHFTRMSGPIVISRSGSGATTPLGSGFNPVTDGNSALQLSGSLYLHGAQSHITASGNISSSGNVTADNFIVGNGGYIRPAVAGGSINFSPYSHGSQEILAMSANAFAVRMDNYDVINISPTTFIVNGGNNNIDFKLHNEDSSLAIHNDASVNRLKFNGFTTITVSGSFNNPHADVSVFGTNTALLVSGSQAVIGDFDVSGNITSSIISAGKSGGSGAVNIYAAATASLYTSASLSEIRFENLPTTPPIVTGSFFLGIR